LRKSAGGCCGPFGYLVQCAGPVGIAVRGGQAGQVGAAGPGEFEIDAGIQLEDQKKAQRAGGQTQGEGESAHEFINQWITFQDSSGVLAAHFSKTIQEISVICEWNIRRTGVIEVRDISTFFDQRLYPRQLFFDSVFAGR
jgi:hypothetical protein